MSTELDPVADLRALLAGAGADIDPRDAWDPARDEVMFTSIAGPALRVATSNPTRTRSTGAARGGRGRAAIAGVPLRRALGAIAAAACAGLLAVNVAGTGPQVASASVPQVLQYTTSSPDDLAAGATVDSATVTLEHLASVAETRPQATGTGDVQYLESYRWNLDMSWDDKQLFPVHQRRWVQPDGSGVVVTQRDEPLAALRTAQAEVVGEPKPFDQARDEVPAGTFDLNEPGTLPRDADTLGHTLVAQPGSPCHTPTSARCVVDQVIVFHDTYPVPGDLDAAFWRVLAQDPDVALLGDVVDRAGRSGIAVAVSRPSVTATGIDVQVLIISPQDGQLLGAELMTYPTTGQGWVKNLALYTMSGQVAAVDDVP